VVACEYCNVTSAIQRRTRIFERVIPPQLSSEQRQMQLRYAVQKHTSAFKWIIMVVILIPLVITVVVIVGVVKAVKDATNQASRLKKEIPALAAKAMKQPGDAAPTWQGTDNLLVGDVDGDGSPEIIGRGRQVNKGDIVRVIALDLATGKQKWQSEPIGTYSETHTGQLAIAGDLIMFASAKAEVSALAVKDGAKKWQTKLDERVEAFCAADDGTIIAVGADDQLRTLARVDGSAVGAPKAAPGKGKPGWDKPEPCKLLPNDDETPFERLQEMRGRHGNGRNKTLGIDVDVTMEMPGGKLLSGSKAEGTHVTLLVATDEKGAEKWRATGAADPLASTGAPRHVALGDKEACMIYYSTEYRIACFALADGKRLWDEAAPSFAHGLEPVGRSLVMSTSTDLQVRDIETGKMRWTLD